MSLLRVEDLHVHYGSIHAIKGISFEVNEGEIVTLIGANGTGVVALILNIWLSTKSGKKWLKSL